MNNLDLDAIYERYRDGHIADLDGLWIPEWQIEKDVKDLIAEVRRLRLELGKYQSTENLITKEWELGNLTELDSDISVLDLPIWVHNALKRDMTFSASKSINFRVNTVRQLLGCSYKRLLEKKGIGVKAINVITQRLKAIGFDKKLPAKHWVNLDYSNLWQYELMDEEE